ncbi:MAG TPA: hypothetical protein VIK93_05675 [Limnochordales bacterium]
MNDGAAPVVGITAALDDSTELRGLHAHVAVHFADVALSRSLERAPGGAGAAAGHRLPAVGAALPGHGGRAAAVGRRRLLVAPTPAKGAAG